MLTLREKGDYSMGNKKFYNKIKTYQEKLRDFLQKNASNLFISKSIRAKLILAFLIPVVLIIILGLFSYSNTSGTVTRLAAQSSETAMENGGKYFTLLLNTIKTRRNKSVPMLMCRIIIQRNGIRMILMMHGSNLKLQRRLITN